MRHETRGPARAGDRTDAADRAGTAGTGRDETPFERADRRWTDLLQEVRVAQTGAQILFAFLVSVAFTQRFATLGTFDRTLYVLTVVTGALATGTLIAPVAYHRMVAGRLLKPELVDAAARLVVVGVVLLAVTVGLSLLLLLHVVLGDVLAWAIAGAVTAWFAVCWFLLPRHLLHRYRHGRRR